MVAHKEPKEHSDLLYQTTLMQIRAICTVVHALNDDDLTAFIRANERADTIGPFIDPTLWMAGHRNMNTLTKVATALQRFKSVVTDAREAIR